MHRSREATAYDFVRDFVATWAPVFDSDEPYSGADALDHLAGMLDTCRRIIAGERVTFAPFDEDEPPFDGTYPTVPGTAGHVSTSAGV